MTRRALITAGFVLLFFLHQDFWWKDDASLVFGILPVSLAYHVIWTLLIAVGWLLVVKFAWPEALDRAVPPASAEVPKRDSSP